MKTELCKCNNCGNILIDENPQVDRIKYEINGNELNMVQYIDNGDLFWACPVCKTDGYLVDL
jgi:hypothetical protein